MLPLRSLALSALLLLAPAWTPSVATAQESATSEAADPLPEMAAIEQAYAQGDFAFVREGLARLANETGTPLAQYRYGRVLLEGRGGPRDPDGAVEWLQKAVDQQHREAATLLARVLLSPDIGGGVVRDPARAALLLSQAAARGDSEAQYYLGLLYRSGEGIAQSDEEAFNWFLAAAEAQNIGAQYELSRAYSQGLGVAEDDEKALKWLQEAASAGHVEAQLFLGRALDLGEGVTANPGQALQWYRRSAEGGNMLAARILGSKYLAGDGVDQNLDEALRWMLPAAESGEPGAQSNLGFMYATGTGVEQDDTQAVEWYGRASESGLIRAVFALAGFYEAGRGVAQNLPQAAALYAQAAAAGEVQAAERLGQLAGSGQLDGLVPPQNMVDWVAVAAAAGDPDAMAWLGARSGEGMRQAQAALGALYLESDETMTEGADLVRQAAEAGDMEAQFRLGTMFTTGTGVEQDYVEAHKWLNVAAAVGHAGALRSRDLIAKLMTPEQVAEAQAAARAYLEADAARAPQTEQDVQVSE